MVSYTTKELSSALNELTKRENSQRQSRQKSSETREPAALKLSGVTGQFLSDRSEYFKNSADFSVGEY